MTTPAQATSLYRFYDDSGALLYIGITNDMARRFGDHGEKKSWQPLAVRVTIAHYSSREAALDAEAKAIAAEAPLYNVQHNKGRHRDAPSPADKARPGGRWEFRSLRSGFRKQCDLFLYPELDGSSMVDDYHHLDGDGQLREYVRYLERRHPEWLEADAVPIYWCVVSPGGGAVFETAPPFLAGHFPTTRHFLSYYEWPRDVNSHDPIDWFSLPVVNDRFPEFAEALAWTPSPFQPYAPLASILAARQGRRPVES